MFLQMRKKCYQNSYIQILKKQQQNIPNSDVVKSEFWELDPSLPNLSEKKKSRVLCQYQQFNTYKTRRDIVARQQNWSSLYYTRLVWLSRASIFWTLRGSSFIVSGNRGSSFDSSSGGSIVDFVVADLGRSRYKLKAKTQTCLMQQSFKSYRRASELYKI